jgi:hypothetical protein
MHATIKTMWIAAIVAILLTAAPIAAQNPPDSGNLTGTYVPDARPTELFY